MAIRYKVVDKNRKSIFAYSKYSIKYKKGKIVKTCPNTIGMYVFKTKRKAQEYIDNSWWNDDWQIIKVQSIGRGTNAIWTSTHYNLSTISQLGERKKEFLNLCNKQDIKYSDMSYYLSYQPDSQIMYYDKLKVLT